MKRQIFYLAAAVGIIIQFCACSKPAPTPVGVLLNRAADKAAEGDWPYADGMAKEVLKQQKHNAAALMIRALACYNMDSRSEAVDHAIHAARVEPELFLAHYIQGMLLSRNGKPELALKALKEARRLRPNDINTLILLAENSIAVRRYQEAAGYFKLLGKNPGYLRSAYLWNGLGVCHAFTNPSMALKFFRMAERYEPNNPVTTLNLAVLYDRYLKNPGNARQSYDRFTRLTMGRAEYDTLRRQVESRLRSLPVR